MVTVLLAPNVGQAINFAPATSMFVQCASLAEVAHCGGQLAAGGSLMQCGCQSDRYGLSWHIVPTRLGELLRDPDRGAAARVMRAMMQMVKLDITTLERAAVTG